MSKKQQLDMFPAPGTKPSKPPSPPTPGTVGARLLQFIRTCGRSGATCDEAETRLELRHQTASATVRHLRKAGFIKDSGARRPTRSGRKATVWVAT